MIELAQSSFLFNICSVKRIRPRHLLIGLLAFAALLVVGFFGMIAAVGTMLAGPPPSVVQQQLSPDGKHKAAVLDVEGGATTGFMWKVAVADGKATKFRSRDDVAVFKGTPGRVVWRGQTLVVFQGDSELYFERSDRRYRLIEYVREP